MKEFIEVIKNRRSVRKYSDKKIPEDVIIDIVDCARLAPTARNEQPWEFIIIRDRRNLEKLTAIIGKNAPFLKNASCCIAVFCRETKYYLEDGCAATQNILLSAKSYGLGSCWIAGDKKEYAEKVRKFLNVPLGYKLISLVSLGYPEDTHSPPKRALEDVIHWEKF
ncbi:MAG: nitroreductase family protein [Candidatus Omnitrophica bacterium]|nr:nitroreductase family protein [Candidatus Omnitrophota bacterium]